MITGEIGGGRHQFTTFQGSDPGNIVGHQAVAALDQSQDAFAFANSACATNQNAHAQNVHHAAELGHSGGKIHFQGNRRSIDELHRNHWRAKHCDFCLCCHA